MSRQYHRVDEERTLIAAAQSGDSEAMGELLLAQRDWMMLRLSTHGIRNDEDGLQNAYIRCMAGIRAYDLSNEKQIRLTTWLVLPIRQAAHDTHKARNLIKIGEHARSLGLWAEAAVARNIGSLDAPLNDRGYNRHHQVMREDTTLDDAQRDEDCDGLRAALHTIHPRYRAILELRIFQELTLQAIGDRMSLTRERVRQLEQAGMSRLRKALVTRSHSRV